MISSMTIPNKKVFKLRNYLLRNPLKTPYENKNNDIEVLNISLCQFELKINFLRIL